MLVAITGSLQWRSVYANRYKIFLDWMTCRYRRKFNVNLVLGWLSADPAMGSKLLAIPDTDDTVSVVSLHDGNEVNRLQLANDPLSLLMDSNSPHEFLVVGSKYVVECQIWNARSGALIKQLPGRPKALRGTRVLVASSSDKEHKLLIWDALANKKVQTISTAGMSGCVLSEDGSRLFVVSNRSGAIECFDIASGAMDCKIRLEHGVAEPHISCIHDKLIIQRATDKPTTLVWDGKSNSMLIRPDCELPMARLGPSHFVGNICADETESMVLVCDANSHERKRAICVRQGRALSRQKGAVLVRCQANYRYLVAYDSTNQRIDVYDFASDKPNTLPSYFQRARVLLALRAKLNTFHARSCQLCGEMDCSTCTELRKRLTEGVPRWASSLVREECEAIVKEVEAVFAKK